MDLHGDRTRWRFRSVVLAPFLWQSPLMGNKHGQCAAKGGGGTTWNKMRILQYGCNFKRYHNDMILSAGEMCCRGRRNVHLKNSKQKKYPLTVQRRKRTTCRLLILQVHPADRDEQSLSTPNLNAEHEPRTTTTNGGLARRNKRAPQGTRLRGEGRLTPFDPVVVST